MSNYVYNTLTISNEYRSKILNSNNEADFNIAVPMPRSFNYTLCSAEEPAVYAYLSLTNTRDLKDVKNDELAQKILKNKYLSESAEESVESAYRAYRKIVEGHPEQNNILYNEGKTLVENFVV